MLEMLPEMVCSEELLCLVAFAELVDMVQMLGTNVPLRRVGEILAAVTADICAATVRGGMERRFNAS